jgi:hypothetical protein
MLTWSRRKLFVVLGVAAVSICLFGLFELPRVTPYQFFSCGVSQGTTQCFGYINPAYPVLLIASLGGLVLVFLGLFDRSFILGPFFILAMIIAGLGLAALALGYIGFEDCASGNTPGFSCLRYDPAIGEAFLLIGSLLFAVNAYSWYSGIWPSNIDHHIHRRIRARLMGIVSVIVGGILLAAGWEPVGTFVFNILSIMGLLVMPIGIWFVSRAFRTPR